MAHSYNLSNDVVQARQSLEDIANTIIEDKQNHDQFLIDDFCNAVSGMGHQDLSI